MKQKITALIPQDLISSAQKISHSKNITDTLIKALEQMIAISSAAKLTKLIKNKPYKFGNASAAEKIRVKNRRVS